MRSLKGCKVSLHKIRSDGNFKGNACVQYPMLTLSDLQHLQKLRLQRFSELLPQMESVSFSTSGQTLIIKAANKKIIQSTDKILVVAAMVLGCLRLEIHLKSARVYFAELQSKAKDIEGGSSMTAAAQTREVECSIATEQTQLEQAQLESEKFISWQIIATKTGETEQDIKRRSTELNISFYWVGESWGMLARDASQLVVRHFFDRGQALAAEIMGEENMSVPVVPQTQHTSNGVNPAATTTKPIKPKASKPTPIKFQGDFTPVKEIPETVKRYLEALAPGDIEAQNAIIGEVTNETPTGKRHLDKLLGAYPTSIQKPTRFKLQSSFKNIGSRRKKEGEKSHIYQAKTVEVDANAVTSD
jgi:hypothetical protein